MSHQRRLLHLLPQRGGSASKKPAQTMTFVLRLGVDA